MTPVAGSIDRPGGKLAAVNVIGALPVKVNAKLNGTPSWPLVCRLVLVICGGDCCRMISSDWESLPTEFVATSPTTVVPSGPVGVPEITAPLMLRPAGRLNAWKVIVGVPLAVIVYEKGTPGEAWPHNATGSVGTAAATVEKT